MTDIKLEDLSILTMYTIHSYSTNSVKVNLALFPNGTTLANLATYVL